MSDTVGAVPCLHDAHGRQVRYLRLSVTDRCNLRCLYCRSNARTQSIPHANVLRYEEMLRLVGIAVRLGVRKIRLTGGEPFARKGFIDFLERLRSGFPSVDIRITSNGTILEEYVPRLRYLGIGAVNLSLDSFRPETFARITGREVLSDVLRALDALLAAGIRVKINAVALRGINDGDLGDFFHFIREHPVDVRFIEFMPMGSDTCWSEDNFWAADDVLAAAGAYGQLEAVARGDDEAGPARMFHVSGARGRFGVITPLTNHFCASCNRLRITSDGWLRTCLFADREYYLRGILRHPDLGDANVRNVIEAANLKQPLCVEILRARGSGAVAHKQMLGIGG